MVGSLGSVVAKAERVIVPVSLFWLLWMFVGTCQTANG
jgi:hypothetical protein